ncbi:MAG: ATP cone domain-containing protein, partial [Thiohalocapsa sp.]
MAEANRADDPNQLQDQPLQNRPGARAASPTDAPASVPDSVPASASASTSVAAVDPQPNATSSVGSPAAGAVSTEIAAHQPGKVQVIRRNGKVTHFDQNKIKVAMTKAFLAVEGGNAAASSRIHHTVDELTDQVASALTRRLPGGGTVHIEDVQDQVELALMRAGEHKVARDYVLYREA